MERLADYPADRLTRRRFLSGPAERSSKMRIRSTGRGTCSSGAATTPPLFQADRWHLQKKKRIEKGSSSSNTLSFSLFLVSFFSYLIVPRRAVSIFQITRARVFIIFLARFTVRLTRELITVRGVVHGKRRNVSKRPQRVSFLCKDSFANDS